MTLMELITRLHATGIGLDAEVLIATTDRGQRHIEDVHGITDGGESAIWILEAPIESEAGDTRAFDPVAIARAFRRSDPS